MQFSFVVVSLLAQLYLVNADHHKPAVTEITASSLSFTLLDGGQPGQATLKNTTHENDHNPTVTEITTSSLSFTWLDGGEQGQVTLQNTMEKAVGKVQKATNTEFEDLRNGAQYVATFSRPGAHDQSVVVVTAQCPDGWKGYRNSCYKRVKEDTSRQEAEKKCKEFFSSAHLADPKSRGEYNFITSAAILPKGSARMYWIGITVSSDMTYIYTDGTRVADDVMEFRDGQVADDLKCVALNPPATNWAWKQAQCAIQAQFICEYPVSRPPKETSVTYDSTYATVRWDSPASGFESAFPRYLVELRRDDPTNQPVKSQWVNSETFLNFSDLNAGHLYFASVVLEQKKEGGKSAKMPDYAFVTSPHGPNNVSIVPDYDKFDLSWQEPDDADSNKYDEFLVSITNLEESKPIRRESTVGHEITIANLTPHTSYSISVESVSIYDTAFAKLRGISANLHYGFTRVGPVYDFRVLNESLGETEFAVAWNAAMGSVDYYQLNMTLQEPDSQDEMAGTTTRIVTNTSLSYEFDDLKPGKAYGVKIVSVKEEKRSQELSLVQTTRPLPLNEWRIRFHNQTVDAVTFQTGPSTLEGEDVFDGYRLEFRNIWSGKVTQRDFGRDFKFLVAGDLVPGSEYEVSAYTKSKGVTSSPYQMEVLLDVAAPKRFRFLTRNETSILLGWDSSRGRVTSYLLTCDNCPGDDAEVIRSDEKNEFVFRDLDPGDKYQFTIQARNEETNVPPSDTIKYVTRTLPNPPKLEQFDHHNETTVIVTWQGAMGTKDGYSVEYRASEGETSTARNGSIYYEDSGEEKYIADLTNLTPGTMYDVTIRTVAEETYSRPVKFSLSTKPNMVRSVDVVEIGEYWSYVKWTPGVGGYEQFDVLLTSLPSGEVADQIYTDANEYNVTLPKPATLYEITVQTIGSGSWTSLPVKRYFMSRPLKVTDVDIYDTAEESFSVRWNPPKSNYHKVLVVLTRKNMRKQTATTRSFVTFDDLLPGAQYDFEIFATFNETNSFSVSQQVTLHPLPPLGLISTGTTSTSLSISWERPRGEVETYFLTRSPSDDSNETGIAVRQETATLIGLTPGVTYTITVSSRNRENIGSSKDSAEIELATDEEYPGPPIFVSVEAAKPTVLRVRWKGTPTPNGIILQYVIRYRQIYPHPDVNFFYQNVSAALIETTLEDLEPGAFYGVSVRAQNSKGPSDWTELIFHQNLETVPDNVANLRAVSKQIRSLDVAWEVPLKPNGYIQEYILTVRDLVDVEIQRVVFQRDPRKDPLTCFDNADSLAIELFDDYKPPNTEKEEPLFESLCPVHHRVDGLSPYTEYKIAVRARTSPGFGNFTVVQATTMEELPSGPPRNITVSEVGPDTATLKWYPPEHPNGVLEYRISLYGNDSYDEFDTSQLFYTLTGLTPFSTYAFAMRSVTGAGMSDWSSRFLLNSMEDVPGVPVNLSGKVLNSESTYLSWKSPDDPRGIILFYKIEIRNVETDLILRVDTVNASTASAPKTGMDMEILEMLVGLGTKVPEVLTETFKHVVGGLRPYTDYEFTVRATTSAGPGDGAHLTLKTQEDRPGSSPTNLRYKNLTSTSVNLTWSKPENPNGKIIAYSIMYISKVRQMRTEVSNMTYVILDNLLKNSLYSVYVNSETSVGEGPSSEGLEMYTDEDVPESPPLNVKYFNVTPTVVRLTWSPPEIPNGIITSYTVYYRNSTGEFSHKSHTAYAILENLVVFGEYWIQVAARTKYGDGGQRSTPLYVRMGEGQPGTPPLNLFYTKLTSTNITLSWQKPMEPNGIIQHYEISLAAFGFARNINVDTPGAQTEFVVRNLTPDTAYTIHIRAHTKHGDGGQISDPLVIRTLEDVPGSAPENLSYENITSTAVLLTWDDPVAPNGQIQFYTVSYGNSLFTTVERKTLVEDLNPFTLYDMKVSASTIAGEGPKATMPVYTDEDEPSSPPRQVTYVQISSTAISLSWLPPLIPNGIIVSYDVKYSGKSGKKVITTDETSVVLSGLENFAQYTATVTATTRVGNGSQSSPPFMFQTLEDAPSDPPYNVTVVSKTSTSLELAWLPPKKPNGIIQFYTIYLVDDNENLKTKKVINQTGSVVDDLDKYSWYNVSVTASTGLGDGNQTSKIIRIKTLPGAPESGVLNLTANPINSTAILVSWSPPAVITGIMAYSVIGHATKDKRYIFGENTTETDIIIGYLEPFKEYLIKTHAWEKTSEESGPSKSAVVNTLEDSPDEPVVNLRVITVTHNSVILAWGQTPKPNGVITSYVIDIPSESITQETPDFNISISDLVENFQYKVSVSPKTKAGVGPPAWTNFTTTPGVPSDPPTDLKVRFTDNARSVKLFWTRPQIPNGKIVSYSLIYREDEVEHGMGKSVQTKSAETEYLLTGLDAYTAYSVVVSGSTYLGNGPESKPINFRTMEDIPGTPLLQCLASGNSSTSLTWKLPQPNGVILTYKLKYYLESNASFTKELSLKQEARSCNISDLLPHSYYIFKLWAETKPGSGKPATCRVKTEEGRASAPSGLNVTSSTSTTLELEWHAPAKLNGMLSHYVVFYTPSYHCWTNGGKMVQQPEGWICKVKVDAQKRKTTLRALRNYAEYTINVAAVTGAGIGERSEELTVKTQPGVPTYEARNVRATDASSTAVNVTWMKPLYLAGPTLYQAKIYQENELIKSSDVVSSNSNFVIVDGLDEDTLFEASVLAITSAGSIESKRTRVRTEEDAPSDSPAMLKIKTISGNSSSLSVQFLPPTEANGPIYEYDLKYKLVSSDEETTIHLLDEDLPYTGEPLVNHSIDVTGLLGGRSYRFKMRAATLIGFGPWTNWSDPVTLPVNSPPTPVELPDVAPPSEEAPKSTLTLHVDICVFSFVNGYLDNITVIVAQEGANLDLDPLHWFQAYDKNPSPPYMVLAVSDPTYFCGESGMSTARQKRSVADAPNVFAVGRDESCTGTQKPFCNGPLKSNTPYRLKIRGTTADGEFTETEFSDPIKTNPTFLDQHLYLLIGLGVGIVVFIFIVSITVFCRRRSLRSQSLNDSQRSGRISSSLSKRTGGSEIPSPQHNLSFVMEPTNARGAKAITRPVAKAVFSAHVSRMSEHNDKGFSSEFDEIESVTPFGPRNIGGQSCNAGKNRFSDIVPYDHYRVKIADIAAIEGSSYINASYIPGTDSPEQYIATQAPLGHTKNDFWRMVWETGSQKIVMLCGAEQDGKDNIAKYWPALSQTTYFGNLAVQCLQEERKPEWTIRTFSIARRDKRRKVAQYHFNLWPLRGVPDNPHPFARFLHATRSRKKTGDRPVVVMCSSGSGRTAVYIAVDLIIDSMAKENRIDPCGVVSELRNYRPLMIQTMAEYSFLHRCLAHVISHHDKDKHSVRSPTGDGVEETTMF